MATASLGWASADGQFDRTLNVTGNVEIDLRTGSGSVVVTGGDSGKVVIHARIHASDNWLFNSGSSAEEKVRRLQQNPPIEQSGSFIRIGYITDEELKRNVSISYEIQTPRATQLKAATGSGDERVSDLTGSVTISSGSGSQRVSNIGGEVRTNSGSGDIELRDVKARLTAETGSGTIRAIGVAGEVHARTGSGDLTIEQTAPGDVRADTGSGTIHLKNVKGGLEASTGSGDIDVDGSMQGSWRLSTGSGSVGVKLPGDSRFEVRAHSSSGGVTVNHPVTIQGAVRRNSVEGSVRGGGPLLSITTGSGSIHVD
jgi:DUF4097 and DUF4098 domain-containing protein YvlB